MVLTATRPELSGAVRPTLVDGDIHTTFASGAVLKKYLSPRWHEYHDMHGKWSYGGSNYPKDSPNDPAAEFTLAASLTRSSEIGDSV